MRGNGVFCERNDARKQHEDGYEVADGCEGQAAGQRRRGKSLQQRKSDRHAYPASRTRAHGSSSYVIHFRKANGAGIDAECGMGMRLLDHSGALIRLVLRETPCPAAVGG